MRSIALAALAALVAAPAAGQFQAARPDPLMDRLSVEVFTGFVPGSAGELWMDVDWWSFTTARHRLESSTGSGALAGAGVRFTITDGLRAVGSLAWAGRAERILRLHSGDRFQLNAAGEDYLEWNTGGEGTALGRIGLEAAAVHAGNAVLWLGTGGALTRVVASSNDEADVPARFTEARMAPGVFGTARLEVPFFDRFGLALAADHHWTWWSNDSFAGGIEEHFADAIVLDVSGQPVDDPLQADGQELLAKMWMLRVGVTYSLR